MKAKLILFLAVLILFLSVCYAGASEKSARLAIENAVDEIILIIKSPAYALEGNKQEQNEILYNKALETFDCKTLSRLALGKRYKTFSDKEKDLFVHFFSKLITDIYFAKMEGTDISNVSVSYLAEKPLKTKRAIQRTDVESQIIQDNVKVPVVYRMMKKPDKKWQVYDIKIEGVSMAGNYREQYRQRISDTPEMIIAELKEKVEK